MLLVVLFALVVAAGFTWWSRRPLTTGFVHAWAASYGLTLTERNWPTVVRYLVRSQRWRRLGVLLGYVLLPQGLALLGVSVPAPYVLAIVSYSVGMVLAAATMPTVAPGPSGASLEPRRIGQYLPGRLQWSPRASAVVLVALSVWSLSLSDPTGRAWIDSSTIVAYGIVLAVGLAVAGEVAERAVIARRQPAGPADLVAADDAMRAQSAHAVAGAVLGAQASLLMPALGRPAQLGYLNPWLDLVGLFAPIVGLAVGLRYTSRAWPMRRASASPPAVPAAEAGAGAGT
jgi:hypothetical protein